MAKLNGDPQDSGGVGTYGRLKPEEEMVGRVSLQLSGLVV